MRNSENMMSVRLLVASSLVLSSAALTACVAGGALEPAGDEGDAGTAIAALTNVPSGVQCIQLVLTGSVASTVSDSVSPGASSATISLGQLPAGSLTVAASAYNVACGSVTSSTQASWVGAPITVTITPGLTTAIPLTLVEAVPVNASVNFVPLVQAIGTGAFSSYAVLTDGTVRGWGFNYYGGLGDGTGVERHKPVAVSGLSSVASVTAGYYHACALSTAGAAWCWGYNAYGQLGTGNTTTSYAPVAVSGGNTFSQLVSGDEHVCGVGTFSNVLCWGYNGYGQLGTGSTASSSSPASTYLGSTPAILAAGNAVTLAYWGNSGSGVGSNPYGQFGMGSTQSTDSVPVSLGFDASGQRFITAISVGLGGNSICALTDLGTVYCAGLNGTGQLGNGTTASSTTPVQVSGLGNVTALASNSNGACALKGDGTVWCWGYNGYGGLGNGTGTPSSTPVQVSGLSSVIAVSGGSGHTCALKSEGTVWCWGWNGDGQLGDGTITNRALPVQVQF